MILTENTMEQGEIIHFSQGKLGEEESSVTNLYLDHDSLNGVTQTQSDNG